MIAFLVGLKDEMENQMHEDREAVWQRYDKKVRLINRKIFELEKQVDKMCMDQESKNEVKI